MSKLNISYMRHVVCERKEVLMNSIKYSTFDKHGMDEAMKEVLSDRLGISSKDLDFTEMKNGFVFYKVNNVEAWRVACNKQKIESAPCGECESYKEPDGDLWYCSKCGTKLK